MLDDASDQRDDMGQSSAHPAPPNRRPIQERGSIHQLHRHTTKLRLCLHVAWPIKLSLSMRSAKYG